MFVFIKKRSETRRIKQISFKKPYKKPFEFRQLWMNNNS